MSLPDALSLRRLSSVALWRLKLACILGAIGVTLSFLFVFDPAICGFYPPCPFHKLTGLYCPGCGSLRAIHQLLHGNLTAALGLNPFMVLSLPFMGYWLISRGVLAVRNRPLINVIVPSFWIWLLLISILLFWILRNIPRYPFTLLAP
jgi:hypothetical protein